MTDAIETLGTILEEDAGRDAIHIAVFAAIAGERLGPGSPVKLKDGAAFAASDHPLGVVDPFLPGPIFGGDRFWMFLMPRTITGLRHVWTHPEFEEEGDAPRAAGKEASEAWLRNFADTNDCPSYETLIAEAIDPQHRWDDEYLHFDGRDAHGEIPDEFWNHVEIVSGKKISRRPRYFSCSC